MNDTIKAHKRSAFLLFKYVEARGNAGNGTTQDQMVDFLEGQHKFSYNNAYHLTQAMIDDGAFNPTTGA